MGGGAVVAEYMLTTAEVAELFRVSPAHVRRLARDPRYRAQLGAVKTTPRGDYRFPESRVRAVVAAGLRDDAEGAA